ncbi:MAG: hypothetical protein WBR29_09825 [Gammaproteobacteria bacterium]
MKGLVALFVSGIFTLTLLAVCATTASLYGRDFSDANVSKIVKGKTTAAQLVELFGEPFQKNTGVSYGRTLNVYLYDCIIPGKTLDVRYQCENHDHYKDSVCVA